LPNWRSICVSAVSAAFSLSVGTVAIAGYSFDSNRWMER
jgi:hypothetical protein